MLDWTGMQDFLAVAETGSLSGAAKKLKVSQPTVGRRVALLEGRLDAPLFVRTSRGLDLTETGELILDHARRMEYEAHAVERLVTGQESNLSGVVTISTIEPIGSHWLVREFLPFHETFPDITVAIHMDHNAVNLLRGEADIAIRMMGAGNQADLICKKVAVIRWFFYASKGYLARKGTPQTHDDFANHDIVTPTSNIVEMVDPILLVPKYKKGKTVFCSNSMATLFNATVDGYGIGIHTALSAQQDPDLVRLFPDTPALEMDVSLVMHPDLKRSARVRAAWDYLSELFRRDRALLLGEEG